MNEMELQLLRNLADKLSTTVEHLWAVMVRQAYISALSQVAMYILLIIWIGVNVYVWRSHIKYDRSAYGSYEDDLIFIGACAMTTLSVIGVVVGASYLPDLFTKLMNPEFWALQQILQAIGG